MVIIEGGTATSPQGFRAGAVYAGIKTPGPGKLDLAIIASDYPAAVAAMFTRNTVKGAAVVVSQGHVRNGRARAIIVNAGISNVANGPRGQHDAEEMCALAAARLGIDPDDVLVGSTGVIGRPLPMPNIRAGVPGIELTPNGGHAFARAIMTTDTQPKTMAVRFNAAGHAYTLGAVAKGVGMIHPDMATMFCFLTTDAPVERRFLNRALRAAVDDSLNMISVDGDTSTSDTTAILANGAAGGPAIDAEHPGAASFEGALRYVCIAMAKMLARDGEGAEKLIEVRIEGAASDREARAAARTVTASPLVKTAVHGNDPNWGRLMMAVGRSGARVNLARARAWLGDTMVYRGKPVPFDEAAASNALRSEEVLLRVDLGAGRAAATAWGCDLTPEYVHINSDYTT
ncbi:MAG: bifunctional glutamate N-acetyltransferase/amino-acid acetyltransferase ArgJ [Chloroflexi bacterium]|nr:bifunctional glutamate N-acetyltransferase/amino-acid acetyltransferase ArgJ [Chloroflexota bacterium]